MRALRLAMEAPFSEAGAGPRPPTPPRVIAGYSPWLRPSLGMEDFLAEASGSGIYEIVILFLAPGQIKVGLSVWAHQGPNLL